MSDDTIPGLYDDRSAVGAQDVDAPVIAVANQTFTVNDAGSSYTPTITDSGTITVSLYSGTLPTGVTLNAATGEISGTPTVIQTVTLRLRVVDGAGNSVISDEFTITVQQGFVSEFFEPFVADDVAWDAITVPSVTFSSEIFEDFTPWHDVFTGPAPNFYWTFNNVDTQANRTRTLIGSDPATLVGVTTGATGPIDEAVTLDASASYIELPTQPFGFTQDWTFSICVKPRITPGGDMSLAENRGSSGTLGTVNGWRLVLKSDLTVDLIMDTGSASATLSSTDTLTVGSWNQVVFKMNWSNGTRSIYVNGGTPVVNTDASLASNDWAPATDRGATIGASRVGATLTDLLDGDVSDVAIWFDGSGGNPLLSDAEVSQLYQDQIVDGVRVFSATFSPEAAVGAPFADYNAQGETTGATISTITNNGSDATGDLTTFGTSNAPAVIDDGDGPVPGAKYFEFLRSNSEALRASFTTSRGTGMVFACVLRMRDADGNGDYIFDGDDATNRNAFIRRGSGNFGGDWSMFAGAQPDSNAKTENNVWVRVVGRFGTDGLLSIERAKKIDASTGTAGLTTGVTVGCRYTETEYGDFDLARLVLWDDGTTVLEAEQWLERAYPFEAVPPGNPLHHYTPHGFWASTIPYIADHGSRNETLACTDVGVELDASTNGCAEQKVFDFNGSTSRAEDDGTVTTVAQPVMFACCARAETDSASAHLVSRSDTNAASAQLLYGADNAIRLSAGATAIGTDLDTLAPFNTRQRWANVSGLFANTNSETRVDGTQVSALSASTNGIRSIALGAQHNGASWTSHFNGKMSDVLIYATSNEANAARMAEVEEWLQRHYRLSTVPGSPFIDTTMTTANVTLNGSDVTDLVNDGSESNFTQGTPVNRPTFVTDDGPEPGVGALAPGFPEESINFDNVAQTEWLATSATFTAKTQPIAALVVYKPTDLAGASTENTMGASDTGTTACQVRIASDSGGNDAKLNAGASLETGTAVTESVWHWTAAEFNSTTSHVSDSEGNSAAGDAGTETHGTRHRIGQNPSANGVGIQRQHRHLYWDDGTTWEEAEEYARRRYPGVDPY